MLENRNILIAIVAIIVVGIIVWLVSRKRESKVVVVLPNGTMGYADASAVMPTQASARGSQADMRNVKTDLPPVPSVNQAAIDRINLSKPLKDSVGKQNKLEVEVTLDNYRQISANQRRYFVRKALGNKAMRWTPSQIYEWLYAYLKGADYFYCNNCSKWWGSKEYYTTRTLIDVGTLENLPAGAKYVQKEGGELITK